MIVEYLIVGGGGAGGRGGNPSGGGGGGAVLTGSVDLAYSTGYAVVVGAGGPVTNPGPLYGGNGGNSSFAGVTALGGGGGGGNFGEVDGRAGGNGGGGGGNSGAAGAGLQGYPGAGGSGSGGGGGGAAGAGAPGGAPDRPTGGPGVYNAIVGGDIYGPGGGGGMSDGADPGGMGGSSGRGGRGGGTTYDTGIPNGGNIPGDPESPIHRGTWATSGTAWGAGGGGGGGSVVGGEPPSSPAIGYQGVVYIRYPGAQTAIGGGVSSIGGYTVHGFGSDGTFTTPAAPTPTISTIDNTTTAAVNDAIIIQGTTAYTHVFGTNLTASSYGTVSGTGVVAPFAAFGGSTLIALNITAAYNAAPGPRTITVTTEFGTSNAMTLTVVAPLQAMGMIV